MGAWQTQEHKTRLQYPLKLHELTLNLFPGAYAECILCGNVFGAVIANHRLAAAFVCGIRGAGTREVFFGGLHRALGSLNSLVHAVPVFARACMRCFRRTISFPGCHDLFFILYNTTALYIFIIDI
jgi:hypothetical protein